MIQIAFGNEPSNLEREIDRLLEHLKHQTPETPEYAATADQIVKLYKLKEVDNNSKSTISADTLAMIAANLLGIGLVLKFEQLHVITTKSLGFIVKAFR